MKTFTSIAEATREMKANTGRAPIRYVVDGEQVTAAIYRGIESEATIYRSGLEIIAEKSTTK